MQLLEILAIAGGIVAIILIAVAVPYLRRKQDRAELATMAALGFHPYPIRQEADIDVLRTNSYLFTRGHSRRFPRAYHSEYGGRVVFAFHYQYIYGLHPAVVYKQLVLTFPLYDSDLPIFSMRPASVVEKIARTLGYSHIKFDANPKFSRSYIVHSPQEVATRTMLSPTVLSYFEGLSAAKWWFEYNGQSLAVYQHGVVPEPKEIPQFVAEAFSLAELLFAGKR